MSWRAYVLAVGVCSASVMGVAGCGGNLSCDIPTPSPETQGTASYVLQGGAGVTVPANSAGYTVTATANGDGTSTWQITVIDDGYSDCFTGYITGQGALSDPQNVGGVSGFVSSRYPQQIVFSSVGSGDFTFVAPNDTNTPPADIYVDLYFNGVPAGDIYYNDGTGTQLASGSYVAFNIQ